jgi:hypothetical protein
MDWAMQKGGSSEGGSSEGGSSKGALYLDDVEHGHKEYCHVREFERCEFVTCGLIRSTDLYRCNGLYRCIQVQEWQKVKRVSQGQASSGMYGSRIKTGINTRVNT